MTQDELGMVELACAGCDDLRAKLAEFKKDRLYATVVDLLNVKAERDELRKCLVSAQELVPKLQAERVAALARAEEFCGRLSKVASDCVAAEAQVARLRGALRELKWRECDTCNSGATLLCAGCLQNRNAVAHARSVLEEK